MYTVIQAVHSLLYIVAKCHLLFMSSGQCYHYDKNKHVSSASHSNTHSRMRARLMTIIKATQ